MQSLSTDVLCVHVFETHLVEMHNVFAVAGVCRRWRYAAMLTRMWPLLQESRARKAFLCDKLWTERACLAVQLGYPLAASCISRLRVSGNDARAYNNNVFRWACSDGHLSVAQWLHATFALTGKDARTWNNHALRGACKNGHLSVAQWLHATFNLTRDDARADNSYAFRWACKNGHLSVAQWLFVMFHLTGEDARVRDNYALNQWLHATFPIDT